MNRPKYRSVAIPPNIKRRGTADYVTYTAITGEGDKARAVLKQQAACYADYMSKLPTTAFQLAPDKDTKDCFLPGDVYLEWADACRESGLIPKEVVASLDEKDGMPRMEIPNKNYPRHRVYSALCAYRFAESFAPLPYCVVMSRREWPHLPFWQHLFYAMGIHNCGSGHSWSYVCSVREDSMTGNHGGGWNLCEGLAAVRLFLMDDKDMHEYDSNYSYSDIHTIAEAISPTIQAGSYAHYPTLVVPGSPDNPARNTVLEDHWIPVWEYMMGKARQHDAQEMARNVKAIYAECAAKDPLVPAITATIERQKAEYHRQLEEQRKAAAARNRPNW